MFFEKVSFKPINNYILTPQFDFNQNTFDNTLCNIYNENGFITNFKYVRPIANTISTIYRTNELLYEQGLNAEDEDYFSLKPTKSIDISKLDREKILGSFTINPIRSSNPNIDLNLKKDKTIEKTTTDMVKNFVKNNTSSFKLMALFFYFLQKFDNLKKFNIYFDFSHSLEIKYMFQLPEIYGRFHFLIFANHFNSLTEAAFSFNSLDSNAFENILGIIKKNKKLTSLKMSIFSQEIMYQENNLLYLYQYKKFI